MAATTPFFTVRIGVASATAIVGNVCVMNACLRKEKRHQSQQPADTLHDNLKKKYESLQKDYKRVGQAFQNQQEQNQELTALLEECDKEAEELANLVRDKDEVVKNLKRRLLNAKKVIADLREEMRRRDQPAPQEDPPASQQQHQQTADSRVSNHSLANIPK